jgi:hypothetical protein
MEMRNERIGKEAWLRASVLRRAASIVAVLALLLGLGVGRAVAAPKMCGDYVAAGDVYSCTLTPFNGPAFHECLTIDAGDSVAFNFTMPLFDNVEDVTCACDATGSAKPVPLSSRSSFTCDARDATSGEPIAVSGKVAAGGRKIVGGNVIAGGFFAAALSCQLDPGCITP